MGSEWLTPLTLGLVGGGGLLVGAIAVLLYQTQFKYATKEDLRRWEAGSRSNWHSLQESVNDLQQQSYEIEQELQRLAATRQELDARTKELEDGASELEAKAESIREREEVLSALARSFASSTKLLCDLQPVLMQVARQATEAPGTASGGVAEDRRVRQLRVKLTQLRKWHDEHPAADEAWTELIQVGQEIGDLLTGIFAERR